MAEHGTNHEAVMSGHGFYNKHSVLQAEAAELGLARLREAAATVPLGASEGFTFVADYGCSQGQNSLRPMGLATEVLRTRTDGSLAVVHTDLPGNDFSALFEALAQDPTSYTVRDPDAFAMATGRSFYEEVLPPATISLGWSSITTHWLSEVPCPVPGHLTAQRTDDPAVRTAFARQAAEDWRGFLTARGRELRPGGRLIMVEPCAHPDGHLGSEGTMALMDQAIAELVDRGGLGQAAADSTTLPVWMRTPDEYEAPIAEHPDLETISATVAEGLPSPFWTDFEADGDLEAFVEASVDSVRAWSEAMLAQSVTDPDQLDWFYERCRELGRADPERLHLTVFHLVLDIERR